jgi:hypothetical protein
MPTTRHRVQRTRKGRGDIDDWLDMFGTIRYLLGRTDSSPFREGWTDKKGNSFWEVHKEEIKKRFPDWQRDHGGHLFKRPDEWIAEIEAIHKRHITKYLTWWTPQDGHSKPEWRRSPVYEYDQEFLTRLNLLTPLEQEAVAKVQQQRAERKTIKLKKTKKKGVLENE